MLSLGLILHLVKYAVSVPSMHPALQDHPPVLSLVRHSLGHAIRKREVGTDKAKVTFHPNRWRWRVAVLWMCHHEVVGEGQYGLMDVKDGLLQA